MIYHNTIPLFLSINFIHTSFSCIINEIIIQSITCNASIMGHASVHAILDMSLLRLGYNMIISSGKNGSKLSHIPEMKNIACEGRQNGLSY